MPNLDYDALRADIINNIKDNPSEDITGQVEQDRLLNIVDSTVNLKTGGMIMRAPLGQYVLADPTDDKEYVTKKWVETNAGGSKEVTDLAKIALLEDDANWTDNIYTGTAITGQVAGDFYISTTHDYKFFTLSGSVTARRIPFKEL